MKWEGKIGPAFVVTLALAVLTGLGWYTDSRASQVWTERVVRLETQMIAVVHSTERIENKIDNIRNGK